MYFNQKVCVVTGAASGIGFAITKALLEKEAIVFLADIDEEKLQAAKEKLINFADRIHLQPTDVTSAAAVQNLIQSARDYAGHLDFVFNNAGIGIIVPWDQMTLEKWQQIMDVNLWSVIYGMHYTVPIMREQGFGHIINTSSVAALLNTPYQEAYVATKAAVTGLGEALRYQLSPENIYITTIHPGNTATEMFKKNNSEIPADAVPVDEAAEIILNAVEKKEGIVIFPEKEKQFFEMIRKDPQFGEDFFQNLSLERKHNFETRGTFS